MTVTEEVPPGYGTPFVYCSTDNEDGGFGVLTRVDVQSATVQLERDPDKSLRCDWLNIPLDTVDETVPVADIIIHKYECDEDPAPVSIDGIDPALQQAGCTSMDGVDFTIEGLSSNLDDTRTTGVDGPGTVQWLGLSIASVYDIIETVPAGYGTPISYCIVEAGGDTSFTKRDPNSSQAFLPHPNGTHVECYWINIPINNEPEDDGSITIYKYTCPDGYDLHAPGADPSVDCTGSGNNIEFWLNGLDPRVTGQELESAVTWEGLSTATYTVSEIVPDWVASVFVLTCDGNSIPMIQSYPLSTGPELTIELAAGDQIVCSWYNVPESPDPGTVTVIKYGCAGPVFVSVDECEIYEGGAGFALSGFDGANWNPVSTGYTNVNGVLSFTGLPFGLYQIDELDGEWCHAVADSTDENGYLRVEDAETTVRVYNCDVTVTKLPPTKYPNTGVGQREASEVAPAAPVLPEDGPGVLDPGTWMGVMDWRLVAPFSASDKPVQISIESIDLSAEIETLEIVDGAFQDPTTSEQVAWYKDTAKLGEDGNLVMAGHLNYWGDPEGVFFALNQVKEGDEIVVTAEDGTVYRYEVIAVSQQVANSRTLRAITQPTDEPTLTLITCGENGIRASRATGIGLSSEPSSSSRRGNAQEQ